jgi:hypothetical protein
MSITFKIERSIVMASQDEAIVYPAETASEALTNAVIQAISTDVEVTAGGITLHLAAWTDPDHWSTEWEEKGVADPAAFISSLQGGA